MNKEERISRDNAIYWLALEEYYERIRYLVAPEISRKMAYERYRLRSKFCKENKGE